MLALAHTRNTLQETMAKLWEDSLFKKQEVVTSCIKPEYTSVILTLKIHWQSAISHYFKTLKQNWENCSTASSNSIFYSIYLHERRVLEHYLLCCSSKKQHLVIRKLNSLLCMRVFVKEHLLSLLTKECLNCIMCQAGRLAKAYSRAPCLCLRLNTAAAFENVTLSRGARPPMSTHAFMDQVCLSPQPAAGGPVLLRRSARARWQLWGLRWEQRRERH